MLMHHRTNLRALQNLKLPEVQGGSRFRTARYRGSSSIYSTAFQVTRRLAVSAVHEPEIRRVHEVPAVPYVEHDKFYSNVLGASSHLSDVTVLMQYNWCRFSSVSFFFAPSMFNATFHCLRSAHSTGWEVELRELVDPSVARLSDKPYRGRDKACAPDGCRGHLTRVSYFLCPTFELTAD